MSVKRERCSYGKFCYRKNPIHRQQAIHPGDPDWNDKEDKKETSKPICPYGNECYRKNPDHFDEYNHDTTSTNIKNAKRTSSKRCGL
jgi:aprataxin and PNK-like factor